jgi:hypothetical protein
MGDALQNIVMLLVTTGKQSLGVNQFYTMHLTGLCEGTVLNATATNATSPFNVTRCMSYQSAGNCEFDPAIQVYHMIVCGHGSF